MFNSVKYCLLIFFSIIIFPAFAQEAKVESAAKMSTNIPDSAISSNVQSNIDNNKMLTGANIKATTKQGIVTLLGTANNQDQVDAAVNAAKGITGVVEVKTDITIVPSSDVPDVTISSNVQSNIDNNKLLTGTDIKAFSKQGIVTLEGTAENQAQVEEAINAAKGISGVAEVRSNITLKSRSP